VVILLFLFFAVSCQRPLNMAVHHLLSVISPFFQRRLSCFIPGLYPGRGDIPQSAFMAYPSVFYRKVVSSQS